MKIAELNSLSVVEAGECFRKFCTSEAWVEKMLVQRPYKDVQTLLNAADQNWLGLEERDYLEAFDGHPKIGDTNSLKAKYANTHALAANEQAKVQNASEQIIRRLAEANQAYFSKFGFIFIVFATGKSAEEMLGLLLARLPNTREQELRNAAEEQRKIFNLRIQNLLV